MPRCRLASSAGLHNVSGIFRVETPDSSVLLALHGLHVQLICCDNVGHNDDDDDDEDDGEDGLGSTGAGERTDDEYCDRDGVGDRLLMNITLWSYAIMLFLRINVRVQALRRTFASETLGLAWPYR